MQEVRDEYIYNPSVLLTDSIKDVCSHCDITHWFGTLHSEASVFVWATAMLPLWRQTLRYKDGRVDH